MGKRVSVQGRSVIINDKWVRDCLSGPTGWHGLSPLLGLLGLDLGLLRRAILRFGLPIRPYLPDGRQVFFFLPIGFGSLTIVGQ